jgi:hypothetical protein
MSGEIPNMTQDRDNACGESAVNQRVARLLQRNEDPPRDVAVTGSREKRPSWS